MKSIEEVLQSLQSTFEKFKKNKNMVSPEDLAGKYKVPFDNLKKQLAEEMSTYIKISCVPSMEIDAGLSKEYNEAFVKAANEIFKAGDYGNRVGKAIFQNVDLDAAKKLADEYRERILNEFYYPYMKKYTCLFVTEQCLSENDPQTPRIYNSFVDKFWDESTGQWIKDEEAAKQSGLLIYLQEGEIKDGN